MYPQMLFSKRFEMFINIFWSSIVRSSLKCFPKIEKSHDRPFRYALFTIFKGISYIEPLQAFMYLLLFLLSYYINSSMYFPVWGKRQQNNFEWEILQQLFLFFKLKPNENSPCPSKRYRKQFKNICCSRVFQRNYWCHSCTFTVFWDSWITLKYFYGVKVPTMRQVWNKYGTRMSLCVLEHEIKWFYCQFGEFLEVKWMNCEDQKLSCFFLGHICRSIISTSMKHV